MRKFGVWIIAALVVVLSVFGLFQLSKARGYQLFGNDRSTRGDKRALVALTLDDGPTLRYTRDVLNLWMRRKSRRPFFSQVKKRWRKRQRSQRHRRRGHQVAITPSRTST